jgi:cellulose synthase/poly-beta-1,6-N-acetylglucosamine synthase-like glycosyltransferase
MGDSGKPKVSVIIPVYDTARYLRRSLDSMTGQTLRDIEIIKKIYEYYDKHDFLDRVKIPISCLFQIIGHERHDKPALVIKAINLLLHMFRDIDKRQHLYGQDELCLLHKIVEQARSSRYLFKP